MDTHGPDRRQVELETAPPRCRQVADVLRREIEAGVLVPGQRVSSVRGLARKFGVSAAVIRSAFAALVREGLLRSEAKSGTFVRRAKPGRSAAALFALITSFREQDINGYFKAAGSEHLSRRSVFVPLHARAGQTEADLLDAIRLLLDRNPSGCFLDVEARQFEFSPDSLRRRLGMPVCVVHRWEWEEPPVGPAVLIDNVGGFAEAFRYLLGKGHKRILYLGAHAAPKRFLRRHLEDACERVGLVFGSRRVPYLGRDVLVNDSTPLRELLARKDAPTAIVAGSDSVVTEIRRLHGNEIPRLFEMETVGKYDTPWSRIPGQEFHTVCIDYDRLWRRALEMMLSWNPSEQGVEYVPLTLLERDRTGGRTGMHFARGSRHDERI